MTEWPLNELFYDRFRSNILSITLRALVFCYALILANLFFSVAATGSTDIDSADTALAKTIISLDKTSKTVFEHHFMTATTSAPAAARQEALLFLAYLESRIDHYCQALYLSAGEQSLEGLPCRNVGPGQEGDPRLAAVPDFSGQTSEEQLASMEEEFIAALGEFDEMLLQEQDKVAAHIPRQREYASGGQDEQPAGAGNEMMAGGSRAQEGASADREGESATKQPAGGQEQTASNEGAGQGRTENTRQESTRGPRDLSEDDDVVARQLREAAEQETDPEVKEKLWEEYRKYKEGTK